MSDPIAPTNPVLATAARVETAASATAPETPPKSPKPSGRWWRWPLKAALGLLSLCLTAVLLLALAAWAWGGQEGSLAGVLQGLQRMGLVQSAEGVRGNLAQGGQVAQLQLQLGSTHIAIDGLELAWQAPALLQGKLQVQRLAAQVVRVTQSSSPPSATPAPAPSSLALPLAVQMDALHIGQLAVYQAAQPSHPVWQASYIQAQYQYRKGQHQARIQRLTMLGGAYQAQLNLGSKRPFALQGLATAQLQLPQLPAAPPVLASVDLRGNLLDIQVHLQARSSASSIRSPGAKPSALPKNQADVQARIQPWGKWLLQGVQGQLDEVDLATFAPSLPVTRISGQLLPELAGLSAPSGSAGDSLHIDLRNSAPAPWDAGGLPISRMQGKLLWQNEVLRLSQLQLALGQGLIEAQGQWQADSGAWQTRAQLQDVDLAQLYSAFAPSRLQGQLSADSTGATDVQADDKAAKQALIRFALDAKNQNPASAQASLLDLRSVQLHGSWQGDALSLPDLQVQTADAQVQGSASYQLAAQNAQIDLQLQAPGLQGQAKGQISARQGQGKADLILQNASTFSAWLGRWPGLKLPPLAGQGQAQMNWQGGWQSPQLQLQLRLPELRVASTSSASSIATATRPATAIKNTKKSADEAENAAQAAPKNEAQKAVNPGVDWQLSQVELHATGPLSALQVQLQGQAQQGATSARLDLAAKLGLETGSSPLRLRVETSRAALALSTDTHPLAEGWQVAQAAPITLQWQDGRAQWAAGKLRVTAPQSLRVGAERSLLLEWQDGQLQLGPNGGIVQAHSSGQLLGLSHSWLEALSGASLADMGLGGQIALDAHWDLRLDEHLRINASIVRSSGDFYLNNHSEGRASRASAVPSSVQRRAGLRDVRLKISGNDQELRLQALWDSEHAGRAQAEISSRLARQDNAWMWPANSPLRGQVQADLPTLGLWSTLAPTGWRLNGKMALNADVGGTRLTPDLRGQLQVRDLAMHSVLDGVELKNGQLQARFVGTQVQIERFQIEGAEGQLQASGKLAWDGGQPNMDISLVAQRLRASNRPDRRVTVSGQVQASLHEHSIGLTGGLQIDEALILLADSSKPSLGSDVRIVRRGQAADVATVPNAEQAAAQAAELVAQEKRAQAASEQSLHAFRQTTPGQKWGLNAAVSLDMGKNFRIRGMGLDTHVVGTLNIHTVSEQTTSKGQMALRPEITGTLRTVGGEYRAYGQWLDIEEGLIRFTGPYNDPRLDILAIRPRTEERVGVRITGPASNPRAVLYAESAMPDSEKLAWLILGREGSNGGAEAAMLQQAAVALLGSGSSSSGLAQSVGLDEIGYRSAETNSDGTVRESSISIGKRLSRNLYLSYERSLSGALGTLYVFYDISRRFTLRAQTNEKASALDVIFTRRYQSVLPEKRAALEAAAAQERAAQIQVDAARAK